MGDFKSDEGGRVDRVEDLVHHHLTRHVQVLPGDRDDIWEGGDSSRAIRHGLAQTLGTTWIPKEDRVWRRRSHDPTSTSVSCHAFATRQVRLRVMLPPNVPTEPPPVPGRLSWPSPAYLAGSRAFGDSASPGRGGGPGRSRGRSSRWSRWP